MPYYTATLLVGAHRFAVPFPKLQTFSEIFWALHIGYSQYEKTILGIFVYLFIYNNKSKFSFLETVQSILNKMKKSFLPKELLR